MRYESILFFKPSCITGQEYSIPPSFLNTHLIASALAHPPLTQQRLFLHVPTQQNCHGLKRGLGCPGPQMNLSSRMALVAHP